MERGEGKNYPKIASFWVLNYNTRGGGGGSLIALVSFNDTALRLGNCSTSVKVVSHSHMISN